MKITIPALTQLLRTLPIVGVLSLCAPATDAMAQFYDGGAVPNWLNQALPNSTGGLSGYSTTGMSTFNTTGALTSSGPGMQNWQIGIMKQDTNVGTLVKGVQSNSPAQRAGVKVDDLIVAVNGQQVGNTPKGLVDIGVLTNQTATNGKIVALIADARTGKLNNVTIDLASTTIQLDGTVRLPNTGLMSSYMTVTLKNVSRPIYEVVGGKTSGVVSGAGPFNFQFPIDPKSIAPNDKYQLEARIDDSRSIPIFVSVVDFDVNRFLAGNLGFVTLNLEPYQQWLARVNSGQVIQAGYTGTNVQQEVISSFQTILGRTPNLAEVQGWSDYLREVNNVTEMKIKMISHQSFYDSVGNDPRTFIIRMFQIMANRQPSNEELNLWQGTLVQYQGNREAVVRQFLSASGSGSQFR